jgi:hypothetical protein
MDETEYPLLDGFMGKEAMDDPQYCWIITLVSYWPRGQTDRPNPSFVLEGHNKPPETIVRGGEIWIHQFNENCGDGQTAFYSYDKKALQWDDYVSNKKSPKEREEMGLIGRTYSKAYTGPIGDPDTQPGGKAPGFTTGQRVRLRHTDAESIELGTAFEWKTPDHIREEAEILMGIKPPDIGVRETVKQARNEGMYMVLREIEHFWNLFIPDHVSSHTISRLLYRVRKLVEQETE